MSSAETPREQIVAFLPPALRAGASCTRPVMMKRSSMS